MDGCEQLRAMGTDSVGDKVIGEDKLIKELGKPPRIEHLLEGLRDVIGDPGCG